MRDGGGGVQMGEMTQTIYAHANKLIIIIITIIKEYEETQKQVNSKEPYLNKYQSETENTINR
jgi:hypothetical protein